MKKLIIGILLFGISSLSLQAQYGNRENGNTKYDSRDNDRYSSKQIGKNKSKGKKQHWRGNNNNRNSESRQINSYQRMTLEKIRQGEARGLITRRESDKLMRYYNEITRKENRYLRNGRLSSREKRDLKQDLDKLNIRINKESRDFQRNRRRRF